MSRGAGSPRAAAARTIASVRFGGRSLDDALAAAAVDLQPAVRSLHAQLCYGTLRHYRAVEHILSQLLNKPLARRDGHIHALLMSGIYELWQLSTPAHAAVAETVNAVGLLGRPPLRGLCNAVLRRFGRERDALLASVDPAAKTNALTTSHPDWLARMFETDWPQQHLEILSANNARAPMWLRVNPRAGTTKDYAERLADQLGLRAQPMAGSPNALRLTSPVSVSALPGFEQGDVSVQDLAAQQVAPWLNAQPGMRVLDACAAPGGKAAHLQELADNALDLLALDADAGRLQRVTETLARLSLAGRCQAADAADTQAWWDGRHFDRILIDAPCSGTGVIRRHPDIKLLRRADDIPKLAERQRRLLAQLWPTLAPGGCLLFATCSVLRDENHSVVADFLEHTPDAVAINQLRKGNNSGLMSVEPLGMQVLPGTADADGFFLCILRKQDAQPDAAP